MVRLFLDTQSSRPTDYKPMSKYYKKVIKIDFKGGNPSRKIIK